MSLPQWFPEYGLDLSGRAKPQKQRQSQVKDKPGRMVTPNPNGWNFGVSWFQNSAPSGINKNEWNAQRAKYFEADKKTRIYNQAYDTGYTGKNHLGSLLSDDGKNFNLPDYEWQSKNKRPVERAYFDWNPENRGTRTVMDYARGLPTDKGELYEILYKGMAAGQADRKQVNDLRKLERDQWAADDDAASKRAAIEQQYMALMDQARRAQEDQARYIQAYNAASHARQARMSDKFRQRFEGDPAQGRSGGGIEAASAKLLTFKGLDNDPKLGARGKLGARSLLGG